MPHMSTLGGVTPGPHVVLKDRRPPTLTDNSPMPSLQFCDNNSAWNRSSRQNKPDISVSSAIDSSVSSISSKGKVRKSFQGLLRRLSGSKDTGYNARNFESLLGDESNESTAQLTLVRRSPSAPSVESMTHRSGGSASDDWSTHGAAARTSMEQGEDRASRSREKSSVETHKKRSVSEDAVGAALRRGRPNTMMTGLPSPLHRRASDAAAGSVRAAVSITCASVESARIDRQDEGQEFKVNQDQSDCNEVKVSHEQGYGHEMKFNQEHCEGHDVRVGRSVHIIDTSPIPRSESKLIMSDSPEFQQHVVHQSNDTESDDSCSSVEHDEAFIDDDVMMKDVEQASDQENIKTCDDDDDDADVSSDALRKVPLNEAADDISICNIDAILGTAAESTFYCASEVARIDRHLTDDLTYNSPCNKMIGLDKGEADQIDSVERDDSASAQMEGSGIVQLDTTRLLVDRTNELFTASSLPRKEASIRLAESSSLMKKSADCPLKASDGYVHMATPIVKSVKSRIHMISSSAKDAESSPLDTCEGSSKVLIREGTPKIKHPLLSSVVTKKLLAKPGSLAMSSPTRKPELNSVTPRK